MHIPVNTIWFIVISLLSVLVNPSWVFAKELTAASLGYSVGATDYYKVTCSGGTDHLQMSVVDQTPIAPPAPQWLNVHLSKGESATHATAVQPASADQLLTLVGGNGKYQFSVDTQDTNLAITKAQSYKFTYVCLYTDGSQTRTYKSGTATIKNGKTTKYTATCSAKKKTKTKPAVDVSSFTLTFSNKTKPAVAAVSSVLLSAQATKQGLITNTTDTNGDVNPSPIVNLKVANSGDGDYFISVNSTNTQAHPANTKQYSLQYSCLNSANQETDTADAITVQDQ